MNLTVGGIIMMAVALFVAASMMPDAITSINDANTTGWSSTQITLWGLIGTFAIIGFALAVLGIRSD